jgi:hypothetical protein
MMRTQMTTYAIQDVVSREIGPAYAGAITGCAAFLRGDPAHLERQAGGAVMRWAWRRAPMP